MRKMIFIFILISVIFSSCSNGLLNNTQETQSSIATVDSTQTESINTPTQEVAVTNQPENTPCSSVVTEIVDSAISFTWSDEDNHLFFSQDPDKLAWREYGDQNTAVDLQTVFPVLQSQVLESIQYLSLNYPAYSISPSGDRVLFWKNAYTKPTPTPASEEVPLTEFEWLLDIYLFTKDSQSERLITRVEGGLVDTYWSEDEKYVYLLFDQLQIPGDYFVVQIDLAKGAKEVILPDIQSRLYDSWIALSPDNNWLAFRYREDPTTVLLKNLISGETDEVSDLPEFDGLYWAKDDVWILIKNSKSGSRFMVFDNSAQEIIDTLEFIDHVGSLVGTNRPVLSSDGTKLAYFGSINPKTNIPTLYVFSLCE